MSLNQNKFSKCRLCQDNGTEDRGILYFQAKTKDNRILGRVKYSTVVICGCYESVHKFCILKKILSEQSIICQKCNQPYLISFKVANASVCTKLNKYGYLNSLLLIAFLLLLCIAGIIIIALIEFSHAYYFWKATLITGFAFIGVIFTIMIIRLFIIASEQRIYSDLKFLSEEFKDGGGLDLKSAFRDSSMQSFNKIGFANFVQDICKTIEKVDKKDKLESLISTLNTELEVDNAEAIQVKVENSFTYRFSKKKNDFTVIKAAANNQLSLTKRLFAEPIDKLSLKNINELTGGKEAKQSPAKSKTEDKIKAKETTGENKSHHSKGKEEHAKKEDHIDINRKETEDILLKPKVNTSINDKTNDEKKSTKQGTKQPTKNEILSTLKQYTEDTNAKEKRNTIDLNLAAAPDTQKLYNKSKEPNENEKILLKSEDDHKELSYIKNNDKNTYINVTNTQENSRNLLNQNSLKEHFDIVQQHSNIKGQYPVKVSTDELFERLESESQLRSNNIYEHGERDLVLNISDSLDFNRKEKNMITNIHNNNNDSGFYLNSEEKFLD